MKLENAVCVITGASSGLGNSLAREFGKRGAKLVLGDLKGLNLNSVVQEIGVLSLPCDVTDHEQVKALAEYAVKKYGRIDLWINNAGVWMPYCPVEKTDFKRAHDLVEVNYFGLVYGTVEALKKMRPQKNGVIVNLISVRGLKGKALAAPYSASKFAAEGFTQAVREELEGSDIKIVGVYPYRMKTALFGEDKHDDYDTSMEPSDVARIIAENIADENMSEHLEIWSGEDVRKKREG